MKDSEIPWGLRPQTTAKWKVKSPSREGAWLPIQGMVCLLMAVMALPLAAQQAEPAEVLWALIVSDTVDATIGSGVAIDANHFDGLLRAAFANRPKRLSLTHFHGAQTSPENIRNYYQKLNAGPRDAILFFYSGHGGMNEQSQEHFLTTNAGNLSRVELAHILQQEGVQLSMIITNCCSNYPPPGQLIMPHNAPSVLGPRVPDWKVFDDTILRHRGMVDITAASPGTYGWVDSESGGFFTNALLDQLQAPSAWVDDNRDGFVSWGELFTHVRSQTQQTFIDVKNSVGDPNADIKRSESQSPFAFRLPGASEVHGPVVVRQFRRNVKFHNAMAERARFWVRYQTLNEGNQWEWFPRGDGWLYYDVDSGIDFFPYHGSQIINGYRIQFYAQGLQSGSRSGVQQLDLVPPEGYDAATLQSIRIRLKP